MAVVLITGCSTGIGLEAALAFARRGDTTYGSMRNLAKADVLHARAEAEGLRVEVVQLDVTDNESVTTAIGAVARGRRAPTRPRSNNTAPINPGRMK